VMVLLIDRCYITIQIIIPVSQLLLWVLGSAGAVLPQCERGAGQSSTAHHRVVGAAWGRGSSVGQRVPTASPCLGFSLGFCGQKTPPGAGGTW